MKHTPLLTVGIQQRQKNKRRPKSICHLKRFLIISTLCYILVFLYNRKHTLERHFKRFAPKLLIKPSNNSNPDTYVIDTEGCRILDLKPFDENVGQYIYPEVIHPICDDRDTALLRNNATHIWVETTNSRYYKPLSYNWNETQSLLCCYHTRFFLNTMLDINHANLKAARYYRPCVSFTTVIAVGKNDECVWVRCSIGREPVYTKLFLFAPKKKFVAHKEVREISKERTPSYNVLIIGIDNVSRLNLHRTMTRTLNYIKDEIGAIEFYGYNTVGYNTFSNVIPLLTGLDTNSLESACIPNKIHSKSKLTLNGCPFVWQKFKRAGFYTAFGEDVPTYIGPLDPAAVFDSSPTDYFTHPFMDEALLDNQVKRTVMTYGPWCVQDRYSFEILLEYIGALSSALANNRLFGFFWEVTFSHFNMTLHYPLALDPGYQTLFSKLYSSGYLNETIVFFLSDHGLRHGPTVSSERGRLESRLPFLYVLVPYSFRENYSEAYENLKLNSRRLTTAFDVHETMKDLLNLTNVKAESIRSRMGTNYTEKRGISLFMPVPSNRTCGAAGIDDQWCTCFKKESLSIYGTTAAQSAAVVERHLNSLLATTTHCEILKVDKILDAVALVSTYEEVDKFKVRVVVQTVPGQGVFEATLVRAGGDDDATWVLAGSVGRLDSYGDQSHCVQDPTLKLYCYCKFQGR